MRWLAYILIAAPWCLAGCRVIVHERDIFQPPAQRAKFESGAFMLSAGKSRVHVAVEPVIITADDGVELRGYRFNSNGSSRYALFCNGSAATVYRMRFGLAWLSAALKLNILALDYRGYGFSDPAAPGFDRVSQDCLIEFDYMRELAEMEAPAGRHPHQDAPGPHLFIMGYSLGGGFASYVASQRATDGVVLIATPTCMDDVIQTRVLPWYLQIWISLKADPAAACYRPQPIDNVQQIEEPVLFIHSRDDHLIPIELAHKLLDATSASDKSLCEIDGPHEVLPIGKPAVRAALEKFISQCCAPPSAAHE